MDDERDDIEAEMRKLFHSAKAKANADKKVVEKKKFTAEAIKNISYSIDEPINGILGYLAKTVARFYSEVECEIDGPEIERLRFNNSDNFPDLVPVLKSIKENSFVEVIYFLVKPNEEFALPLITERFTINLNNEGYEIMYKTGNNEDFSVTINYEEMIKVEQIQTVRTWVSQSVLKKIATAIDG